MKIQNVTTGTLIIGDPTNPVGGWGLTMPPGSVGGKVGAVFQWMAIMVKKL